jgi:hypothetical protein
VDTGSIALGSRLIDQAHRGLDGAFDITFQIRISSVRKSTGERYAGLNLTQLGAVPARHPDRLLCRCAGLGMLAKLAMGQDMRLELTAGVVFPSDRECLTERIQRMGPLPLERVSHA